MKDKEKIYDEIKDETPLLASMKIKLDSYPDADFFSDMQDAVLSEVKTEAKVISISKYRRMYGIISIAASFLLLFGLFNVFNSEENPTSDWELADTDSLMDYMSDNIDDYELANIYALDEESMEIENVDEDLLDEYLEEHIDEVDMDFLNEIFNEQI